MINAAQAWDLRVLFLNTLSGRVENLLALMGTASLQFALKIKIAPLLFSVNDGWEENMYFILIYMNCWLTEMLLTPWPRLITIQNLSSSLLWQYQAGTLVDFAIPWPDCLLSTPEAWAEVKGTVSLSGPHAHAWPRIESKQKIYLHKGRQSVTDTCERHVITLRV